MTPLEQKLRVILRRSSSPMPVSILAERTGKLQGTVANALKRMPDAHIVCWLPNDQNRAVAHWDVIKVPEHAPRPARRGKKPTSGEKICD